MIRLALLADPHVHDCDWQPPGTGLPHALRSYADTAASTRVFNESVPAFRAALQTALAHGAKLAILAGDLTDDGQRPHIDAAMALLNEYRGRGLRVFATPGNHDFYALCGRPQRKGFLGATGARVILDSAGLPEAATLGTAEGLARMALLGFTPDPKDLYWETPFGRDPDFAARMAEVASPDGRTRCRMIDASYLVEPVEGLWLLSLDANVCVPRDGASDFSDPTAFHDPTDGGWPLVLRHRSYLLSWMADVARRAAAQGKTLLAFSHYPALDALGGTSADELALFGAGGLARRAPPPQVAEAFAATGVRLHFSGHLHVNDVARHRQGQAGFFNVALPSSVAFPPALKFAEVDGARIRLRTHLLTDVAGHDRAFAAYRTEAHLHGEPEPAAAHAPDHGAFMDAHLCDIVRGRYISREWPQDMADLVMRGRLSDLRMLIDRQEPGGADLPLLTLAEDWYRLRKGADAAHSFIPAERRAIYHRICSDLPESTSDDLAGRFIAWLRLLRVHLERPPTDGVTLDLVNLTRDEGLPKAAHCAAT